jgi:tight adherence protein C
VVAVIIGLTYASQPGAIQKRLEVFGGSADNLEELELQQPFRERVARPLIRSVARLVMSRTPQSTVDKIRHDLLVAGQPAGLDVRDFLGMKGVLALLLGVVFFLTGFRSLPAMQGILFGLTVVVLGFYLPNLWLGGRIRSRQKEIQKALPDAHDLLTICVEAGLGFDDAMHRVTEKWTNALAQEFGRVLTETRMGKSRREALRDMVSRTEVQDVATFIAALIQADQLGVSIGNVLITQAEQMRVRRRQRAEELAQKAPIKMLFPMILLIFPSLWVVILGPAIPSVVNGFAK